MRHRSNKPVLDRKIGARGALLKNLAGDLLDKEKIVTTTAKAKAMRPYVEKIITLGKKQTLAARRLLAARLPNNGSDMKVYNDIAKRYAERQGGYLRIIKLPRRGGDGAEMSLIELV